MAAVSKTIGTATHAAQTGTLNAKAIGTTAIVGTGTNFDPEFTAADRLLINHPLVGWHSYDISAVADDTHMTIVGGLVEATAGDEVPYLQGTARDYSTITLWEAADGGGDGLGNDDCTGSCYNDSAFDESVTINFVAKSIVLTVAAGERHDGTAGTGARIVKSTGGVTLVSYTVSSVVIRWLEWDGNANVSYIGSTEVRNDVNGWEHCILHGAYSTNSAVRGMGGDSPHFHAHDCLVYDISTLEPGHVLRAAYGVRGRSYSCYLRNVTVHDIVSDDSVYNAPAYGVAGIGGDTGVCINVISTDTGGTTGGTTNCFAATVGNESYNLSSDATASGTGSLISKTSANQFVSTSPVNLHLAVGADAIGAGVDLGQTPAGVEFDIDNFDRHTAGVTWDMGADQYVAAVTGNRRRRVICGACA